MPESVRPDEPTGNGPTQGDYEDSLAEFTELKTAAARLAQKIKTCLGNYESKGGSAEEIKFGHKMGKLEKGEAAALVKRLNRAARWSGVIAWEDGGQANFTATFDQPAVATGAAPGGRLSTARAYNDGWNSGMKGALIDSSPYGHAPGSREFVTWRDGWEEGQRDRAARGDAPVDTSRERPNGHDDEPAAEDAPKRAARKQPTSREMRVASRGSVSQHEPEVEQRMTGPLDDDA